ncbi:MAG: tetratricopeptide repeat protein, partial [Planctomycetota bacterium]|nr:tetratricopeptide repeat protein [Planctomycetota bacterium]
EQNDSLVQLRARCLFELEDYPACEKVLQGLLESSSVKGAQKAALLAQLARLRSWQQAHSQAAATIQRALQLDDSPQILQVAVSIALRARDHTAALPHIQTLLKKNPGDARANYHLGLAQLRQGKYELAIPALRRGLEIEQLRIDASFELAVALRKSGAPQQALALLIGTLEDDPARERACYQASRCLLEIGGQRQVRVSAWLLGYFKALKNARGASSRDQHLAAAGRASEAWLARSAVEETLGNFSGALEHLQKADGLAPGSPGVILHRAGFWIRRGLLAQARKELTALETPPPALLKRITGDTLALLEMEDGKFKGSLLKLATCQWADSEKLIQEALQNSGEASAQRSIDLARLLLARNPSSLAALQFLLEKTSEPDLIIPRLHYLGRLSRIKPGDTALREELATLRKLLLGT